MFRISIRLAEAEGHCDVVMSMSRLGSLDTKLMLGLPMGSSYGLPEG